MRAIKDNSEMYRPSAAEHTRSEEQFQVFPFRVLTVDYERKILTIEDLRTETTYAEVYAFPAGASSFEGTEVAMPEPGATGLAVPIAYDAGFAHAAIISWTVQDTFSAQDAIAFRPVEGVEGLSVRGRATYRKAYPGQSTKSTSSGFSERIDTGWDRSGQDLSRDHLDAGRRRWTQITSRKVQYTGAGFVTTGPADRPNAPAAVVSPNLLVDGSQEFPVYLAPAANIQDRYVSGKQDVIQFAETLVRVQEYSLDYPVPEEVLDNTLLDTVLGSTADPWMRTTTQQVGGVSIDNESFGIDQKWDHPYKKDATTVGPTTQEGPTPLRRGFMIEKSEGTLIGFNQFDLTTYGHVLKPVVFPYTAAGRFGADTDSGYLPVNDSADHVEARLAASASSERFTQEYNTTRFDVTKEGFMSFEIGATLPTENIPLAGGYEHPHGAGRSIEGHLVGSLKLVIGKNKKDEEAIDLQALGQVVMRLGADDLSLPDRGRSVRTQQRSLMDTSQPRTLQYWKTPGLKVAGDAGDLANKTGGESISLRAAFDGGTVIRMGAKNPASLRRHLINGYMDGPGKQPYPYDDSRIDSHSNGRRTYGAGDNVYAFHDLTTAGTPQVGFPPINEFQSPLTNMDTHGLSLDAHLVRDLLLRVGKNPASGQSVLLDTDGGTVMFMGKDNNGRSITGQLDGGVTLIIGQDVGHKGIRLEVNGDVDMVIRGNKHEQITGDYILECNAFRQITKTDHIITAQKVVEVALARHTTEAPDIVNNQGLYSSDENS